MPVWLDQLHRDPPTTSDEIDGDSQPYWYDRDQAISGHRLHDYVDIFRRRKWILLLSLFTTISVVILGLVLSPPRYEAQALIAIEERDPKILSIQEVLNQNDSRQTVIELIQDRITIGKVIDALHLDRPRSQENSRLDRDALPWVTSVIASIKQLFNTTIVPTLMEVISPIIRSQERATVPASRGRDRQDSIEEFQEALKVIPREGTSLVDITLQGDEAHRVTEQLNTLLDIYVQDHQDSIFRETQLALAWLRDEVKKLKLNMQEASSHLHEFRSNNEIIDPSNQNQQDINILSLMNLSSIYLSLKRERIMLESHIRELTTLHQESDGVITAPLDLPEKTLDLDSTVLENYIIKDLYDKYIGFKSEILRLSQVYKDKHPKVTALYTVLAETKHAILKALQHEYQSLLAKENKLRRELVAQRQRVIKKESERDKYTNLKNDFEVQKNLYLDTLKKQRELALLNASGTGHVKIVRGASVPLKPVSSKALYKVLAGLVVGLGIGAAFACVAEYGDKRFKQTRETESYLQLPLLSVIPKYKAKRRRTHRSMCFQSPHSEVSEAYRILRTRLLRSSRQPICTLLVTSALPMEGKSTTTTNLGLAFAQCNQKVLLVDVDLRHPSLHRHFHLELDDGLADILMHGMDWREVIHDTSIANLKVLTTGTVAKHTSDLLHTEQMRQLIESLKVSFDMIIFDAPIVLSIPDVEMLAYRMDGVLLVHNPEKYNKETTMEAKTILERADASVLGIVFNNVSMKKQRYTYYHKQHMSYYKGSYHASNGRLPDSSNGARHLDIIEMKRMHRGIG